jgi:hypothetical protein
MLAGWKALLAHITDQSCGQAMPSIQQASGIEYGGNAMIPQDNFTPYGYLDNPYHSWKMNPSGVLRSLEPLGMGWHVPNLGSYVRNQFRYSAHLMLGLKINDTVLVTPQDFQRQHCIITSDLHTKNRFAYTCLIPSYHLTLTARYFLIQQDTLGCIISLATTSEQPLSLTCYLIHTHTHNPFTSRLWEHGFYALQQASEGCAILGLASEGDVFIHGVRAADGGPLEIGAMGYTVSLAEVSNWARGKDVSRPYVTQNEPDTGFQWRAIAIPAQLTLTGASERILNVVLARSVSQDQAYQRWREGVEEVARAEADARTDDEAFWQHAPQLSGDWPASWRRGFVYDLETLRMVMRPPAGIIPTVWDGMQIQAPRTVLAEAAMDSLFLSYADPALAAEVILGHFESALHPNLPCMREDGSYNMVADDGQICGTAPEWGFPIWCCDQIFRRTGDVQWLRRLFPRVSAYLRWWLEQRVDDEGWLVYACSWESGQDVSSRFGPQQTGGTIIQHMRPVDLQASMVQAASIMARWAVFLSDDQSLSASSDFYDFAAEAVAWEGIADAFTVKTRLMWRDGWFRDYDSLANVWSTERDAMHLAPIFCGAAGRGHIEQLLEALEQPPSHSSGWAPLSWPPVVMTLVGAAAEAKLLAEAAELAYSYIESAYSSADSRELTGDGLPGVTREYHRVLQTGKFGATAYVNAGIEGYGWGALSIHLLIRYLLGLREEESGVITIAPHLPQVLRKDGAIYRIGPLPWGKYELQVECGVRGTEGYSMTLHWSGKQQQWEGRWGEGRQIHFN